MTLRRSPLASVHADRGARLTEFNGWEMPLSYDSIRREHAAVRGSAGIFDVSHMGQLELHGPDATALLDRLSTNDVAALAVGDAQYTCLCDENGVIRDDTVCYRLADERYLAVPNAGKDGTECDRWTDHRNGWGLDAAVTNRTEEYAMFAVQGPDSAATMGRVVGDGTEVTGLDRFTGTWASIDGIECWVARTGYTGEDGFELVFPWGDAERVWSAFDCQPCGLGARDTLRLEAGLLLSGQDFHPVENPRNPFEAGLVFVVDLDKERFVGRDALAVVGETGVTERLVGLELRERGVPRHGYTIHRDGERVGTVTSGTLSPTLDVPIALGYVGVEHAELGTQLAVNIRDRPHDAVVTDRRFMGRRRT